MHNKKRFVQAVLAAFLLAANLSAQGEDVEYSSPLWTSAIYGGSIGEPVYMDSGNYATYSNLDPTYYHYEYDNSRYLYEGRPYDTGFYYYDASCNKYGSMTRYNGYYNTSYNAGAYTSGISSYPGTSTGPGISNGYHATPKGVYRTDSRYYDRNLRVNPYR